MRVLIVEDETAAVDNLEYLLRNVDRAIEIAAVTESVEQTQQWLMQNHADLILWTFISLMGLPSHYLNT